MLSIWNERVAGIRKLYKHVRTVVLIKSNDLLELVVFEFETVIYPISEYKWQWNKRNNLEGYAKKDNEHVFTWQPHGSQFTIIESVTDNRLAIRIRKPHQLDQNQILDVLKFDDSWVEVL